MPFELRPFPHPTLRPEGEYLQRAWNQSVLPLARRMGVTIRLPAVSPQPYTRLAWEGYRFAQEHGRGDAYNHRVLEGFFVDGLDIGQIDVLTRLAGEIGLDEGAFQLALESGRHAHAHRQALQRVGSMEGISGVPAFVIGDQILVGMQSKEALQAAFSRVTGHETEAG